MRNTALALNPMNESQWSITQEQAAILVRTGFLPEAINTPEKALAVIMKGRELGIPAMYALSNIVIIKGKPAANAELMLSLIYRDHGDAAIEFTETTNARCTIRYKRRNARNYNSMSFTWEQAHSAGLLTPEKDRNGNPTMWHKYPEAMLRARCISAVARIAFPDTIAGMYTPDELGAETDGETGEVVVVQAAAPPAAGSDRKREKMIARIHALADEYLELTGEDWLADGDDLLTEVSTDDLVSAGKRLAAEIATVKDAQDAQRAADEAVIADNDPVTEGEPSAIFDPALLAHPRQIKMLQRMAKERGIDIDQELGDIWRDVMTADEAGATIVEWQKRPRLIEEIAA